MSFVSKKWISSNAIEDEFDILCIIGEGTFGIVRIIQSKDTRFVFALKEIRKAAVIQLKQLDHIKNEKEILIELSNEEDDADFIVKLFRTMEDRKSLYFQFEYLPGGELFTHLHRAGKFPNDVAKFYAAEVILALEYLHSKRIVYRDLKLENICLDVNGHIKLIDFGFAKRIDDGVTWTLCGTPEYLAPEIILGIGHGFEVDWWALGVLIYEMIVGYPPFFQGTPYKTCEQVLRGRVEFPVFMDFNAKELVKSLLKRDKSKRLGCLVEGADGIKTHLWFKGVDWNQVKGQELMPPIPIQLQTAIDSKYFAKIKTIDTEFDNIPLTDEEQMLFEDF